MPTKIHLIIGYISAAVYLILLFRRPMLKWLTPERLRGKTAKEVVENIKVDQQGAEMAIVRAVIERADGRMPREILRDKVYRAIDYAIKRHDWFEDQRSRILTLILTVASLALTVTGLLMKSNTNESIITVAHCVPMFITVFTTVVMSVYLFNSELDRDRPYRLISDIRFWFFRYNLRDQTATVADLDGDVAKAQGVAQERNEFFKRTVGGFSPEASLREDLEQLYILHVLERSKSESLTKLRHAMFWSFAFLIIQIILLLSV